MERNEVEDLVEMVAEELEKLGLSGVDMDFVVTSPIYFHALVDGLMERLG